MLYIVGGVPRSGKTQVQKYLLKHYEISGISIDTLREGFHNVAGSGISDSVNDLDKSAMIWPYVKGIILAREKYTDSYVLEGVNLLPVLLSQLKDSNYLKICFMGYTEIDPHTKLMEIRRNISESDWTYRYSDVELLELVEKQILRSKELKAECEIYGIKYFDTSLDFHGTVKSVAQYLVSRF